VRWVNIYHIRFNQQKTKGVEMLPISELAFTILGERDKADEKVLNGINLQPSSTFI
jgi:hypothetical protein